MRTFLRDLFRRKPSTGYPVQLRTMASGTSAVLYAATVAVPSISATRPEDEITKSRAWHNKEGKFVNPWPSFKEFEPMKFIPKLIWRNITGKANKPDTTPPTVPVQTPTFLPSRTSSKNLRVTWLGHACYYAEFPTGLRVLFDPVFTERCSPLSWLGPKRYTKQPCEIKDLPIIDAVVISHSHYDHLSHPTVMEIAKQHPECHFIVPMGNKKWFADCGISKCTEMDWWEEIDLTLSPATAASKVENATTSGTDAPYGAVASSPSSNTIKTRISCLPSQHMANRGLFDRGQTLWASWGVTSGKSLYFAGDTGYRAVPAESDGKDDWAAPFDNLPHCPAFADIGKLRGPFDLGLIPIGAYEPRWAFSPVHANPRDAVEIFRDTQCKKALGMHWGTWVLTEEEVMEPPRLLKEALKLRGFKEEGDFDVCDIGESREY